MTKSIIELYLSNYVSLSDRSLLKKKHIFRVAEISRIQAKKLGLSKEDNK